MANRSFMLLTLYDYLLESHQERHVLVTADNDEKTANNLRDTRMANRSFMLLNLYDYLLESHQERHVLVTSGYE